MTDEMRAAADGRRSSMTSTKVKTTVKCTVKSAPKKKGPQNPFHPRGLSANRFWSGIFQGAQNPTWRLATLIKSRVLMALATVGERWQNRGQKVDQKWTLNGPNSAENIPEQFHPKSGSNHCKRLIYLAKRRRSPITSSFNFIYFLKFHTCPQISQMRAQRAPVPQ